MARPNTAEPRTHRLEARIAPKALELIKRAAEAKGSSLSISSSLLPARSLLANSKNRTSFGCQLRNNANSSPCCSIRASRTSR